MTERNFVFGLDGMNRYEATFGLLEFIIMKTIHDFVDGKIKKKDIKMMHQRYLNSIPEEFSDEDRELAIAAWDEAMDPALYKEFYRLTNKKAEPILNKLFSNGGPNEQIFRRIMANSADGIDETGRKTLVYTIIN